MQRGRRWQIFPQNQKKREICRLDKMVQPFETIREQEKERCAQNRSQLASDSQGTDEAAHSCKSESRAVSLGLKQERFHTLFLRNESVILFVHATRGGF